MMQFGLLALSRSPLARMVAVLIAEYLARKGFIALEDISQTAEDVINIIGFFAMAATLLIWQWRTHHPAKAHLDVEMPVTEEQKQQAEKTSKNLYATVRTFFKNLLLEKPQQ